MSERQVQIYGRRYDYDAAYASFDGNMPGCLGKDCSNFCCREKTVLDHRNAPAPFRTSLLDETEYFYQSPA